MDWERGKSKYIFKLIVFFFIIFCWHSLHILFSTLWWLSLGTCIILLKLSILSISMKFEEWDLNWKNVTNQMNVFKMHNCEIKKTLIKGKANLTEQIQSWGDNKPIFTSIVHLRMPPHLLKTSTAFQIALMSRVGGDEKFCWWEGVIFLDWWESEEECLWPFKNFSKLKTTICKYWILIKIKIRMSSVSKKYEGKTKIVQK